MDMLYKGIFWSMWNFDIFTVQNLGCIGVFSIEVEHFVVIKYFLITKKTEKILSPACFVNIILSLLWPSWFLLFPFTFLKHFSLFYENKILFSFSTLNSFLFKKKILLNAMIMFRYMSGVFSCLTSINVFITIACSGDSYSR